jgi:hypothetical protein
MYNKLKKLIVDHGFLMDEDLISFGEIVVKECLNECDVVINQHEQDLGPKNNPFLIGAMNVKAEIEDHFGL